MFLDSVKLMENCAPGNHLTCIPAIPAAPSNEGATGSGCYLTIHAGHGHQTLRQPLTIIADALKPDAMSARCYETNDKYLIRSQRRQEFHHRHPDSMMPRAPRRERLHYLIQNDDAGRHRIAGKMPNQTRMLGGDDAAVFRVHRVVIAEG